MKQIKTTREINIGLDNYVHFDVNVLWFCRVETKLVNRRRFTKCHKINNDAWNLVTFFFSSLLLVCCVQFRFSFDVRFLCVCILFRCGLPESNKIVCFVQGGFDWPRLHKNSKVILIPFSNFSLFGFWLAHRGSSQQLKLAGRFGSTVFFLLITRFSFQFVINQSMSYGQIVDGSVSPSTND